MLLVWWQCLIFYHTECFCPPQLAATWGTILLQYLLSMHSYLQLPELATLTHSSQTEMATVLFMLLSPQETEMSHRPTVWIVTARGETQSVVQKEWLCCACQHGATVLPVYQKCWQSNAPRVCQKSLAGSLVGLGRPILGTDCPTKFRLKSWTVLSSAPLPLKWLKLNQ